jgi:hypothetical protein
MSDLTDRLRARRLHFCLYGEVVMRGSSALADVYVDEDCAEAAAEIERLMQGPLIGKVEYLGRDETTVLLQVLRETCAADGRRDAVVQGRRSEIERRDAEIARVRKALGDLLAEMTLDLSVYPNYDVYQVTIGAVDEARAASERKP